VTEDQEAYLKGRIQSLRSRQKNVGPFRAAGIQRTIDGMKEQLKTGVFQSFSPSN
jgi:hypothetical protein